MAKLTDCKLKLYPYISEWIAVQEQIINDLLICNITIDDEWPMFYIISNLPNHDG
jgi:hypothetical protein